MPVRSTYLLVLLNLWLLRKMISESWDLFFIFVKMTFRAYLTESGLKIPLMWQCFNLFQFNVNFTCKSIQIMHYRKKESVIGRTIYTSLTIDILLNHWYKLSTTVVLRQYLEKINIFPIRCLTIGNNFASYLCHTLSNAFSIYQEIHLEFENLLPCTDMSWITDNNWLILESPALKLDWNWEIRSFSNRKLNRKL